MIKYNDLVVNCTEQYFNQDRLNIINMAYSNAQSLWNAGSCSSIVFFLIKTAVIDSSLKIKK